MTVAAFTVEDLVGGDEQKPAADLPAGPGDGPHRLAVAAHGHVRLPGSLVDRGHGRGVDDQRRA